MGVALFALAFYFWRHGHLPWALGAIGAAVLLPVLSFVAPSIVRPLADGWLFIGRLVGRITTPILLTIVFITVVTPLGLLLRLFGSDPLRLKRDPKASTYWIERKRRTFAPEDFERLS
jgi:hypothetical protein